MISRCVSCKHTGISVYWFYFTYTHVYHAYHSFKAKLKSEYLFLHAIIIANKNNLIEVMIEVIVIIHIYNICNCLVIMKHTVVNVVYAYNNHDRKNQWMALDSTNNLNWSRLLISVCIFLMNRSLTRSILYQHFVFKPFPSVSLWWIF